jgi:hypothetical protein
VGRARSYPRPCRRQHGLRSGRMPRKASPRSLSAPFLAAGRGAPYWGKPRVAGLFERQAIAETHAPGTVIDRHLDETAFSDIWSIGADRIGVTASYRSAIIFLRNSVKQITLPHGVTLGIGSSITPRLLSRDEAAAYCGICPNTFSQYVAKEVAPIKFGRRKLWDINALDKFIGKHTTLVSDDGSIDDWLQRLRDAHSDQGKGRQQGLV